ncbi:YXWGXW repeat-containing protein [Mucilaginibacter sp.]|uniref:YXWGXW repeat-containing protein n=1 Tax=Mucilaginibacter sp. TaxID=1882438 RepID=UPI0026133F50|nr:YXWGXW repeat-containing protein [Mucilaginibacter sp.]MDB4924076.1 hypothetical protein [Mucilaginibacter sp.]
MKKLKRILFASAAIVLFVIANGSAQVVVRTRMVHHRTVTVRPARPSANHVWIESEWTPRGRTYVERPGYWAVAPHPGGIWVSGHWAHHPRGYVWVPGHWR